MFISSAGFGMDLPNTLERAKGLQDQFRDELIEAMGRTPSDPGLSEYMWCPIKDEYVEQSQMIAGHLFPARATQATMDAIFGQQEQFIWRDQKATSQPGVKGELFRACNGIYWSKAAEDRFRKGYFVLVPDLESDCTKAWQESSVKEYRVRVMRPDVPGMQKLLSPYNRRMWKDLDGRRVMWGNPHMSEKITFRPRARYLYWSYLTALLRNVHATKESRQVVPVSIAQGQIGRKYWGSAGAYVKKNMLLGFLEEVGHAYDEELMEAVIDPGSKNEPAKLAVMTAIEDILNRDTPVEELDDDDDDDDD